MMVGSVSGPAIGKVVSFSGSTLGELALTKRPGPCIGGIIVTFAQWRIIYWLQFGMALLGFVLSWLFVPSLENKKKSEETQSVSRILKMFNPLHIFRPLIYPNVFLCVSL